MSNPFSLYSSQIVTKLFAMDRTVCRDWIEEIRRYLETQGGFTVESIHEYLTADGLSDYEIGERSTVLAVVVKALGTDDQTLFYASDVAVGDGATRSDT